MIEVEVEIAHAAWLTALPHVAALIRQAADGLTGEGQAVVLLADNERVGELNRRFRGRDTSTNVLSFPAVPNPLGHLGDIALAFEICQSEACAQAKPLADHLRHLVVHGLLHLLGYDHEIDDEGDVMETLERNILQAMGIPDPYDDGGQDRSSAQP